MFGNKQKYNTTVILFNGRWRLSLEIQNSVLTIVIQEVTAHEAAFLCGSILLDGN